MTDKPEIPLPLPGDVDVSNMDFMPMIDTRLVKSRAWLSAKNWRGEGPGLGFAMLNLWIAAFREVPAGSLEDDDEMLADAAKVSMEHWLPMKEKAMRGWERHGGRVWHRTICELSWDLWLKRLNARHENAINSWRMSAKRATDKGNEPPDPPGPLVDWIAAKYPATAAYQAKLPVGCSANNVECSSHNGPKRSEGKVIPPIAPQDGAPNTGKERGSEGERKRWFAGELARLQNEFRPMVGVMQSELQRPGVGGEFALVQTFKGCWLGRGSDGKAEIVTPSKQRANAIVAAHGPWLRHYWPDLSIRHAKVDELRARGVAA